MADEVQVAPQPQSPSKPVNDAQGLPKGGPFNAYGKPVTVAAVMVAAFTFLDRDPAQGVALLERFGIRWLFYCGLLYVVYDLAKLVIKQLARLVSHVGNWAQASQQAAVSQARLADGVQAIASKSDRAMEEQARLTTFSVNASQRSVELVTQGLEMTKDIGAKVDGHTAILVKLAEKAGVDAGA